MSERQKVPLTERLERRANYRCYLARLKRRTGPLCAVDKRLCVDHTYALYICAHRRPESAQGAKRDGDQ